MLDFVVWLGVSAERDDADGVVFAQVTGAYRLDDAGGDRLWRRALLCRRNGERHALAGARRDLAGRLFRLRVVILTIAVLTVTAAVLVGVLA
ncbi:hypothetical protein ACWGI9_45045 [Streptomyces sp. NPDC054833]